MAECIRRPINNVQWSISQWLDIPDVCSNRCESSAHAKIWSYRLKRWIHSGHLYDEYSMCEDDIHQCQSTKNDVDQAKLLNGSKNR